MTLASTQAAKIELRRGALAKRTAVFAARGPAAAEALVAQVAAGLPGTTGKKIAGYWPIGAELDCRPALADLHARGAILCLPVAGHRGDRLVFRIWKPGAALETGPFGTFHPAAAETIEPDILLVPLLAFDAAGHRLGYGAGYYDRTLAILRTARSVCAWGLAFDEQELPSVPTDPTDALLDGLITDKRLLRFAPSR
jgi:5-formyltetrahydrofolate cyclo-ligase